MTNKIYFVLVMVLGAVILNFAYASDEEYYLEKASSLMRLSSAVEARVLYEEVPDGLKDKELVEWATSHDKVLYEPFRLLGLKVNVEGPKIRVLVCDVKLMEAYLEDYAWTAKVDVHYWETDVKEPCEFPSMSIEHR